MKSNFIKNIPDYTGIGVYAIINNRTGKKYIGSSKNVRKRIKQHLTNYSKSMTEDIESGDTFSVEILEKLPYGSNQFEMFGRESYYIESFKTLTEGYHRHVTTCSTKQELEEH